LLTETQQKTVEKYQSFHRQSIFLAQKTEVFHMKIRILTTALLAAAILVQPAIGSAQKRKTIKQTRTKIDRWYTFVSPDGDFTLSFPQKPSREPDGTGPASPIRVYALYTEAAGNQMMFHINFQDTSGDPDAKIHNEWDEEYERAALAKDRDQKRHIVNTRRIGKNGFEKEIWDSSSSTGDSLNMVIQTILRKGRIYTLACSSEIYGRPVNKSICRRFFNSLHFIPDKTLFSRRNQ
jgi:hypothetical protein